MKNLNSREIANHIYTSVKETYPDSFPVSGTDIRGRKIATSGEYSSRDSYCPDTHLRTERNFKQSLWGRR